MTELADIHLTLRPARAKRTRALIRSLGANLPPSISDKLVRGFENAHYNREASWPEERNWFERAARAAVDAYRVEKRENPAKAVRGTVAEQERKVSYVRNQLATMEAKLDAMREAEKE